MADPPVSTPDATQAQAQSRSAESSAAPAVGPLADTGGRFRIGPGVEHAHKVRPHQRDSKEPLYRPLRIFALDPGTSMLAGSIARLNVPWEPVAAGPVGCLFEIAELPGLDPADGLKESSVDLNEEKLLLEGGLAPSPANQQFHQQMVYAVCSSVYAAFRHALGRHIGWPFNRGRLRLHPHDKAAGENAYYNPLTGAIHFGYYRGDPQRMSGDHLPGGLYFTCLSHDVIVHEVTHALLDGLRARFSEPTNVDVLAFHEAFADLVAVFQHFSYDKVLRTAIRNSGGDLRRASLVTDLAAQFGHTTGRRSALRTAVDVVDKNTAPRLYSAQLEPHALGSVLVSAVFEAFANIFDRKAARYVRLATGGSGVLSPEEMPDALVDILAERASRLASQFLSICIRAIDYCPPVDVRFGDYLRAMITADRDLVSDDRWAYREAIIDAFRRRAIFPERVNHLSEDALLWERPATELTIRKLDFASLKFRGDPQHAASASESTRQASALGKYVTANPERYEAFSLLDRSTSGKDYDVDLPCVESIRSTRRSGPDGQIVFDLVAEITQRRTVVDSRGIPRSYYGGCTVILGPEGNVRYVVTKGMRRPDRLEQFLKFGSSAVGSRFWIDDDSQPRRDSFFRMLHGKEPA